MGSQSGWHVYLSPRKNKRSTKNTCFYDNDKFSGDTESQQMLGGGGWWWEEGEIRWPIWRR